MKRFAFLVLVILTLAGLAPAAEPEAMSFDQAFEQLKTYDYGQNDKPLRAIEAHVGRADAKTKTRFAERLASVLADAKAPTGAKVFACQQLLVIGTEAQTPLLAKMLENPQTAEIARFTLEAIPGEASLAAIRGSLDRLEGMPLLGAVNSLGQRRDAKAVPALAKLLAAPDPLVAAAAVEALGKIATPEAAAALAKAAVPAKAQAALHNAQLQCAERLASAGDAAAAAAIYETVWSSKRPVAQRVAGLAGLAKVAPEKASPVVLESLAAPDAFLRATAARLAVQLRGVEATAGLVRRMEKLDPAGQALVLGVLAERGDRSAADAVAARLDAKDDAVRLAAVAAMARLGDAAAVAPLARIAAAPGGAVQQAARTSLARLTGPGVESKLAELAAGGEPTVRIEICRAVATRRMASASPVLLKAASEAEPQVRVAAIDALGVVAPADAFAALVRLLTAAPTPVDAAAAERAILAAGERLAPAQRLGPVLAALRAAPGRAVPPLLRVLGGFGDPEALEAVRARLADADPAVRDAAIRALAAWPDASAAPDLLRVAQAAEGKTHRGLAIRGYLRLAGSEKDEAARLRMLEQVRPIAKTADAKRMLLAAVSEVRDAGALHVAVSLLDDADVAAEAAAATLSIGKSLVRIDPAAVRAAMRKLAAVNDKAVADEAAALEEEAIRMPTPGQVEQALQRDAKRSDARKAALARSAPPGYRLACYLDCGPDVSDGVKGGPLLRLVAGDAHFWPGSEQMADLRFGTVFFGGREVVFEASGLDPKKSYQIGFSWWDQDHATRVQSVWLAASKGQRATAALAKTKLPSGENREAPETKTLPVAPALYADGTLRISFRNESQPNAVVSEIWLWEGAAGK